ncbi:MAG: glycosyltransferase [Planctomycetes bacterium]|nr:glycosyltransferase [Planctomycetota bacterium]
MDLSVVIPVYNEEANLPELHQRLRTALDPLGLVFEIVFVDDGSADGSRAILRRLADEDPRVVAVELNRNYGQHAAIFAGFGETRGGIVVTLDADLQNPPEEIPKLLAAVAEGHDVVGGYRRRRRDTLFRRIASRAVNRLISAVLGVEIRDCGCMLRAYRRDVVDRMCASGEVSTFIPALAITMGGRATEIEVEHAQRAQGESKYSLWRLVKLQFDLMTSFSMLPLRLCSALGLTIAAASLLFSVFLIIRRLIVGPEVEGVFTLFAILFFVVGCLFLALGILGEYVGRIYAEVRDRPRFVVRSVMRGGREVRLAASCAAGVSPGAGRP